MRTTDQCFRWCLFALVESGNGVKPFIEYQDTCNAWVRSLGTRACSRKPLCMLIAAATPVGNALSAQERDVALHASLHRTPGEIAVVLAVALAVENCRPQPGGIEVGGYAEASLRREWASSRHHPIAL